MKVKLRVVGHKNSDKTIDLKKGTFFLGRGQDCDLRARSDIVSRRHCRITVAETSVVIQDLESKNGTFVNDDRIVDSQELRSGDTIQVGPLRFELLIETAQKRPAATPQPVTAVTPKAPAAETKLAPAVKPTAVKPTAEEPTADLAAASRSATDKPEDDISQWLDDNGDDDLSVAPAKEAGLEDTDAPGMDDTRQVSMDDVHTVDGAGSNPTASDGNKQNPGKLPPVDSKPSKDSGEAAANVLRQFSRRR